MSHQFDGRGEQRFPSQGWSWGPHAGSQGVKQARLIFSHRDGFPAAITALSCRALWWQDWTSNPVDAVGGVWLFKRTGVSAKSRHLNFMFNVFTRETSQCFSELWISREKVYFKTPIHGKGEGGGNLVTVTMCCEILIWFYE